ncbi:MAG: cold shock and DUF1294 domain-containing protein [Burkholderiales bacterium]|nr:cold shock and DUF1294 domain-containing protein [Burkholderiales bacterium]MBH2017804.1 cold shock and DUF1294 domain-containing protein [Burkholderiales bacterium]
MRFDGTLTSWNDERGFGFIEAAQGGDAIFVHIKAFGAQAGRPQVGQRLTFEVELGPQGKKRAHKVERAAVPRAAKAARSSGSARAAHVDRTPSPARWGTASLFAIPLFLVVALVVSALWRPPVWLAGLYLGASVLAFVLYASDKAAAQRNAWRVSEQTLHGVAILGGWPGALLAQQWLRHKSVKAEFRATFWFTVLVNVSAFVVLCSPQGQVLWRV